MQIDFSLKNWAHSSLLSLKNLKKKNIMGCAPLRKLRDTFLLMM